VALGGGVLGVGVGGLLGPLVQIARQGLPNLSTSGAVMGALYGTVRVAAFGAFGGLLPGLLRAGLILMREGADRVGDALLTGILTSILMALGWAAAGAFIGVFFGAALGAVGGYDS
jgi:hypothetical protein